MKNVGADRIEFYTGPYAENYPINKEEAIRKYIDVSREAVKLDIGINAGHDLSLENLTVRNCRNKLWSKKFWNLSYFKTNS